jgi:SARP family transcriptional regulator, regulator of embCAB operon
MTLGQRTVNPLTDILLADDQAEVRSAIRLLLEHEFALDAIHEAGDLDTALCCVRDCPLDVVILDWELDVAIAAFVEALRACPGAPRLLAISGRPQARTEAMDLGVDGFVSKTEAPEVLLSMLRALLARERP